MSIYHKTEKLAQKFEAVYPDELSAQLSWWGTALGISRLRLLRLIGMSARQAAQQKSVDLKKILKTPEWEENARLVEGGLHRLLALFHYDWHCLAEGIHALAAKAEEPSEVTRRKGKVNRLQHTPNGTGSDLLINRMAEGGRQSLSAILACLAESRVDSD